MICCWVTPVTYCHRLLTDCISLLICHTRSFSFLPDYGWPPMSLCLIDRCEKQPGQCYSHCLVKETKSPVPLPWGNRTASCGRRCCRTSGRILSSPTTSCRSGTRFADTHCTHSLDNSGWCQVIVMALLYSLHFLRYYTWDIILGVLEFCHFTLLHISTWAQSRGTYYIKIDIRSSYVL